MYSALRGIAVLSLLVFCVAAADADTERSLGGYGDIPLAFTANGGQIDNRVMFTTTGGGCSMFFTPSGTTFMLSQKKGSTTESFAAKLTFVGANQTPAVSGEDPLPWKNNYFTGDRSRWRTGITNYGKIRLSGVYDGIDLVYYGNQKNIEYDFIVVPGKNAAQIALRYDLGTNGANALSVNEAGDLVVKTPFGNLVERKPYCYQVIDGKKVEVAGAYTITDATANVFGFALGEYDVAHELFIDPVLAYSTFLGGSNSETGGNIVVDDSGCAYVIGYSYSSGYPVKSGSYDTGYNEEGDVVVTKLNAAGNALVFSTFLGGNTYDYGNGIAVDDSGYIYVAGTTCSSNFPVTPGAYDTTFGGDGDAFVAKLTPNGTSLVYSTFIGGGSYDSCINIAIDDSGYVYLAGTAQGGGYPVTAAAFDTTFNGCYDAFATKLSRDGSALVYSTFLGGSAYDYGRAIAVDGSGNAYVAGHAQSANFPVTPGAFRTTIKSDDGYIAKLNPSGSALVYSTYLGGTGTEEIFDITLDTSRAVYVTGHTYAADYPVTPGAYGTSKTGYDNAFVTKLSPDGSALVYSTYLGGGGNKYTYGQSVALDDSGNAYVTGCTSSTLFPVTTGAYDTSFGGGEDAFVTKLNPAGTALFYSTLFGGGGYDRGMGIAVKNSEEDSVAVYVGGYTGSGDFPVTLGAFDTSFSESYDLFVMKMNIPTDVITVTSPNGGGKLRAGISQSITWASQNVENVKIEYSADGSSWTEIVVSTPASPGTYAWTVPDTSSATCRIRITDVSDAAVTDVSDSAFTIRNPRITVTSPAGGESWRTGTTHTITWTSGDVDSVAIALYTDNGTVFDRIIATARADSGSYVWTVPAGLGSGADYRIKVSSAADSTVYDMSDAEFTIYTPVVTVISPNGGEKWRTGTMQTISWTSIHVDSVAIRLCTDSGATLVRTIAADTPDSGSYGWIVPADIADSSGYRVKITSLDDSTVYDVSDADFSVYTPRIAVTSPNGGEKWRAGSNRDITWLSRHVTNVKIECTFDGSAWTEVSASTPADSGTYSWTVPDTSSATCRIRIMDVDDSTVTDVSDGASTILNPRITVTAPNGGESWRTGTTHDVIWIAIDADSIVDIELYADTFVRTIVSGAPNTGSFSWTIPAGIESRDDYRLKIVTATDSTVFDLSGADFALYTPGITVTAPNGGESWRTGTTQTVSWTSRDVDNLVTVMLYPDSSGTPARIIADSAPNSGGYSWTIPADISTGATYRIKVIAADDSTVSDMSDAAFTIFTPTITVTAPNGGERWRAGSAHEITWTSSTVAAVNLEYSMGGSTWTLIAPGVDASEGTYRWPVPLADSADCRIRLSDASDSTVTDTGDSVFTVYSNPGVLLSPVHPSHCEYDAKIVAPGSGLHNYDLFAIDASAFEGGGSLVIAVTVDAASPFPATFDMFTTGTPIPVSGVTTGAVASAADVGAGKSASIAYHFDKGAVFYLGAEGSGDAFPDSEGTVSFTASVVTTYTLTSPNGGEKWAAGKTHEIIWTSADEADSLVNIQLFREDGSTLDRTIASSVENNGSYFWNIPSDLSEEYGYRIRIVSAGDSAEYAGSVSDFLVYTPRITVTAPNGAEKWIAGTTHAITWTCQNMPDSVSIRLYRNGGATFDRMIASPVENTGEYSWAIPADIPADSTCRIRIVSAADSSVYDMSDADFSIEPFVSVVETPMVFVVSQAHPNPFNPSTAITVSLPAQTRVVVKVFNLAGQEVATLHTGNMPAGNHSIVWNAKGMSSGVYFCSVRAGVRKETRKIILLK